MILVVYRIVFCSGIRLEILCNLVFVSFGDFTHLCLCINFCFAAFKRCDFFVSILDFYSFFVSFVFNCIFQTFSLKCLNKLDCCCYSIAGICSCKLCCRVDVVVLVCTKITTDVFAFTAFFAQSLTLAISA